MVALFRLVEAEAPGQIFIDGYGPTAASLALPFAFLLMCCVVAVLCAVQSGHFTIGFVRTAL
jgi:hypothetical protein